MKLTFNRTWSIKSIFCITEFQQSPPYALEKVTSLRQCMLFFNNMILYTVVYSSIALNKISTDQI